MIKNARDQGPGRNNQGSLFIAHIEFQGASGYSPRDQGKLAPVLLFNACRAAFHKLREQGNPWVFNQFFQ